MRIVQNMGVLITFQDVNMSKTNITILNILAVLALVIVAGSALYYFVIYPPMKEKELQKLEAQRVVKIDSCIKETDSYEAALWERECLNQGLEKGCNLPTDVVATINSYRDGKLNICYQKYPKLR